MPGEQADNPCGPVAGQELGCAVSRVGDEPFQVQVELPFGALDQQQSLFAAELDAAFSTASGISVADRPPRCRGGKYHLRYVILRGMTKALKEAVAEIERLPDADQEKIGRQVLHHVEKLRALRADIDAGLRSLDAGKGKELDMRDVISRAHARHERG